MGIYYIGTIEGLHSLVPYQEPIYKLKSRALGIVRLLGVCRVEGLRELRREDFSRFRLKGV